MEQRQDLHIDDLEQSAKHKAWFESSVEFTRYLNINEIHSHIRRYLTAEENEKLLDSNLLQDQKIKELMEFFPRKGGKWFKSFIDALEKTKANTGHDIIIKALKLRLSDAGW